MSSIIIPSTVTAIGSNCFNYCYSLSSIIIPSSVTTIGTNCFSYCYSLSSIIIPSTVTTFDNWCFANCSSLSSIIIPPSVTAIGSGCFSYCSSLSSIIIPPSGTTIGSYCFGNCYKLTTIQFNNGSTQQADANAFSNMYKYPTIICYQCASYDDMSTYLKAALPSVNETNYFFYDFPYVAPTPHVNNPTSVGLELVSKRSKKITKNNINKYLDKL